MNRKEITSKMQGSDRTTPVKGYETTRPHVREPLQDEGGNPGGAP